MGTFDPLLKTIIPTRLAENGLTELTQALYDALPRTIHVPRTQYINSTNAWNLYVSWIRETYFHRHNLPDFKITLNHLLETKQL